MEHVDLQHKNDGKPVGLLLYRSTFLWRFPKFLLPHSFLLASPLFSLSLEHRRSSRLRFDSASLNRETRCFAVTLQEENRLLRKSDNGRFFPRNGNYGTLAEAIKWSREGQRGGISRARLNEIPFWSLSLKFSLKNDRFIVVPGTRRGALFLKRS